MVAYSFKRQFVAPIQVGLGTIERIPGTEYAPKRQTIRAYRKRHARPGEEIQLYCGMRTKHCFLIGRARCTSVDGILLRFGIGKISVDNYPAIREDDELDIFAQADGFKDFAEMAAFWHEEYGQDHFEGIIIKWEPLP